MRGHITRSAVLALTVTLALLSGHAATRAALDAAAETGSGTGVLTLATPSTSPEESASMTVPDAADQRAVVVPAGLSSNSRGWSPAPGGAVVRGDHAVRAELVDAYSLAVLLAPKSCHLSLSLLAAIGQVESGNLAGHEIDIRNRAVPGVLGPVLDGTGTAAVPDSDNGRWDGHKDWDRALGPMQLLPATWREVGLDADGDGVRDPQNVYDSAGAAMVYLCADGRDLSTPAGLSDAVWSYNHSRAYVRLVMAWKTAYDAADITGVSWEPAPGTWQVTADPFEQPIPDDSAQALRAPRTFSTTPTRTTRPTEPSPAPARPSKSIASAATPSTGSVSAKPSVTPTDSPSATATVSPSVESPSVDPTCPTPSTTPTGTPTAEPTVVPTADPSADPTAEPTAEPDPCAPSTEPIPTEPTGPSAPVSSVTASPSSTPTAR